LKRRAISVDGIRRSARQYYPVAVRAFCVFVLSAGLVTIVFGQDTTVDSPDLQVGGFTVFGTNTTGATSVTSGWGSAYMDGSLQVHSNLVVQGEVTSTDMVTMNRVRMVQGIQVLTGLTSIQPTNSYIRIQGDGDNVDIQANPQIAPGYAGQLLTLQGTANNRRVLLEDGNGLQTQLDQPFSLGLYDTLQLIFDPSSSNWIEVNRSNNRSSN
jgi:hypothetical protein